MDYTTRGPAHRAETVCESASAGQDEKRSVYQQWMELVPSGDAFDLSWSQHESGLESRCLCGWECDHAPIDALARLALDWGMDAGLVAQWRKASQNADVGITINRDLTSLRLYTHRWPSASEADIGAVVYRGYKCLPDGGVRVDEYIYRGDLREPSNLALALSHSGQTQVIKALVQNTPPDIPLLMTTTHNTQRLSWLATFRHARLDAGLITSDLQGYPLAHLAGGHDATKGEFDSFYISSTPAAAMSFVEPKPTMNHKD